MLCEADLAHVLVGDGLEDVRRRIAFLAGKKLPVLILGESGVGKEVAARALAELSGRPMERFVTVNAATLTEPLAESLLFGHARGAFTGAVEGREGLFEASRGGTLFLDEIGDLPSAVQAKLLRILDGHSYMRLGETRALPFETWLILATNANLNELARQGRFREDLLHRMLGSTLEIPPLRERKDDIPALVDHFLARLSRENGLDPVSISGPALEVLRRHPWPGNVRQLRNFVTIAMQKHPGETISPAQARLALRRSVGIFQASAGKPTSRRELTAALKEVGGNVSEAARRRGVSRQHMYRLLRSTGLRPRAESASPSTLAPHV